jgi:sulfate permease, SulP family
VIAFRSEPSLNDSNSEAVLRIVLDRIRALDPSKIRLVICDLPASPILDLAGLENAT